MTKRKVERVNRDRRLSPEEADRYGDLREQIANEWPKIEDRIRQRLAADPARAIVQQLKQARAKQGLSLAEVSRRSGLKSASLTKLESGEGKPPSMRTLERYANAVGKRIKVSLVDESSTAG